MPGKTDVFPLVTDMFCVQVSPLLRRAAIRIVILGAAIASIMAVERAVSWDEYRAGCDNRVFAIREAIALESRRASYVEEMARADGSADHSGVRRLAGVMAE